MNEIFRHTLINKLGASSNTAHELWDIGTEISFPAKHVIAAPNEVVTHSYFIFSGAIQQYSFTPDQKKHVLRFFKQGDFFASMYLKFFSEQKAQVYSKTITEIKAIQFSRKDMVALGERNPNFFAFLTRLYMQYYRELEENDIRRIQFNSTERYQHFTDNYPDLVDRIPAKIIAEHLGIHPGSLSRIKASLKS